MIEAMEQTQTTSVREQALEALRVYNEIAAKASEDYRQRQIRKTQEAIETTCRVRVEPDADGRFLVDGIELFLKKSDYSSVEFLHARSRCGCREVIEHGRIERLADLGGILAAEDRCCPSCAGCVPAEVTPTIAEQLEALIREIVREEMGQ